MSSVFLTRFSGATYTPPRSLTVHGFSRPRVVPLIDLAGRDGAVVSRRSQLEPRRGALQGTLRAATWTDAQALLNALLAAMQDAPLQLRLGSATGRFITVWPENVDDTATTRPAWLTVNVPLVAPDPYFYAHAETWDSLGAASQSVWNAGDAIVEPLIRIVGGTGSASAITIGNTTTGQSVTFSGTVSAGQVLLIDPVRRTATRAGVGVLTLMNQPFRVSGFRLNPGANTITRSFTGAVTGFHLVYRARWL